MIHKADWKGALTDECIGLRKVEVDTWGGWIFINMDPDCEPLRDYLEPAATMLDPFELENMRYRWRKFGVFDCNWKVAMEAFNETYHVQTTHPEFNKFGEFRGWARAQGQTQQHRLRRAEGHGREPAGKAADRIGRRPAHLDCGDAGLHLGEGEHQHDADARRCGAPAGRRAAGRNSRRPGAQALARVRAA